MKLKYILPVATIASVATIVTPLVSCGNNGGNVTPDPTPDKDGWLTWDFANWGGFKAKPTTTYGHEEVVTEEKLTTEYFRFIKEDYTNFMKDWFLSLSDIHHDISWLANKDIWQSRASIVDETNHLLKIDFKWDYDAGEFGEGSGEPDKMQFDLCFDKMEMEAERNKSGTIKGEFSSTSLHASDWTEDLALKENGWSIKGTYTIESTVTEEKESKTINLTKDNIETIETDYPMLYTAFDDFIFASGGLLSIESAYLSIDAED